MKNTSLGSTLSKEIPMKKQPKKLTLNRETLGYLDGLRSARGGTATAYCTHGYNCTVTRTGCDGGTTSSYIRDP